MRCGRTILAVAVALTAASQSQADDKPAPPDYSAQVAPILKKYCAGCHQGDEADGGLSVESFSALQKGGESGPALLAGNPDSSRMIRLLNSETDTRMPPEGEPRPSDAEIGNSHRLDCRWGQRSGRSRTESIDFDCPGC